MSNFKRESAAEAEARGVPSVDKVVGDSSPLPDGLEEIKRKIDGVNKGFRVEILVGILAEIVDANWIVTGKQQLCQH